MKNTISIFTLLALLAGQIPAVSAGEPTTSEQIPAQQVKSANIDSIEDTKAASPEKAPVSAAEAFFGEPPIALPIAPIGGDDADENEVEVTNRRVVVSPNGKASVTIENRRVSEFCTQFENKSCGKESTHLLFPNGSEVQVAPDASRVSNVIIDNDGNVLVGLWSDGEGHSKRSFVVYPATENGSPNGVAITFPETLSARHQIVGVKVAAGGRGFTVVTQTLTGEEKTSYLISGSGEVISSATVTNNPEIGIRSITTNTTYHPNGAIRTERKIVRRTDGTTATKNSTFNNLGIKLTEVLREIRANGVVMSVQTTHFTNGQPSKIFLVEYDENGKVTRKIRIR